MNIKDMTRAQLIDRIELLENMEIGITVLPSLELIIIDPDRNVSGVAWILTNTSFINKKQIMFTAKCREI